MTLQALSRLTSLFLFVGLLAVSIACGGRNGNPGTPGTPGVTAPQALVYATNPAVYTLGQPIAANASSHGGGAVTGYTVSPALPAGLVLDATTGTLTGTPTILAVATTYTVTATNGAGSTTASLSITVRDQAPSALVYATNPAVYTLGVPIVANPASHGGGTVTSYAVSPALPAGLTLNAATGTLTGTPTALAVSATYTVTATNSGGSTTASLSITVNDAAPSALVYAANPATYTLGVPIAANVASHGGGAVTGYAVSPTLPAGLALNATTGTVTGTPTALSVAAAYTVTASNSVGSTTASLSIAVNEVAPSGLVYAFPTATYTVGTAITPNTASHGGGAVTQYAISPALPPGLNLNTTTGLISGTPSAPVALSSYTVTASNSGGSTTAALSITVNDLPPTGLTYAVPVITGTVGTAIANNAPSHGGGAVTQYTVSPALPVGLDLNFSTGLLSGTPTVPAATATYTVTAGNSGGSTTFGVSITVNPAVTGKAWFSAITLSTDQPGDGSSPQLAFAGNGQAMAVWEQSGGGVESVWARRFTPGSGWSPAVVLEASTTESAVTPHVAMDAAGNALVVWLQRNAALNTYSIWANQYAVGTGWVGAVQLEAGGLGASAVLRVSMDAAGHGLAVWAQVGATLSALHAARYQPGSGWAAVEELAANNAGDPDLAMNANGEAMVVWSSEDVPGAVPLLFSVWGRPYNAASGWGTAVLLESDSVGGWDVVPSVAIDPVGRAVAVWQRLNSVIGRFNIRSNRYTPGGGWGTPEFIDTNLLGFSRDPRIALDANGNGLAVWDQADSGPGGHISIWGNRFTLSSGWGTSALIEAPYRATDNAPAQSPQVALDPSGNGFAIWLDFGGDINGVAFTPSAGWGTPRGMAPGTTQAPGPPQIAFDGNGNAIAIWSQVTGPSSALVNAIWVSRYE